MQPPAVALLPNQPPSLTATADKPKPPPIIKKPRPCLTCKKLFSGDWTCIRCRTCRKASREKKENLDSEARKETVKKEKIKIKAEEEQPAKVELGKRKRDEVEDKIEAKEPKPVNSSTEYLSFAHLLDALQSSRNTFSGHYSIVADPNVTNHTVAKEIYDKARRVSFDQNDPLPSTEKHKDTLVLHCTCNKAPKKPKEKKSIQDIRAKLANSSAERSPRYKKEVDKLEQNANTSVCGGFVSIKIHADTSHPLGIKGQRVEVRTWH
uniref:Uncharacterized protein n=1 Tax=Moniliophthora roreri TaxID=221103 RepID=A0A0W0FIF2_MONRR